MNVHPDRAELDLFVSNRFADSARVRAIAAHLAECEFCREYCDNYRLQVAVETENDKTELTPEDRAFADRLYHSALRGKVIALNVLPTAPTFAQMYLAADGQSPESRPVTNLATLYSEDPELVLRVMRDTAQGIDYLQLIGADPELVAHALIQIPEIPREFVADASGRVNLGREELKEFEKLRWQIKLPDARFDLRPLVYDPEHVESVQEITLETEQHDRILVTLAGKTAGKQILIRVLALDGKSDFGSVRVSISQQSVHAVNQVTPNQIVPFDYIDPNQEINIRLFR